jgi:hypothetical protein
MIGLVVMLLPIALDIRSLYWEADDNVQLSDKECILRQNSTSYQTAIIVAPYPPPQISPVASPPSTD